MVGRSSDGPARSRAISIAAALIFDADGRLLVVRKRGTSVFIQPGGKVEPGETARDAVHREVAEELGVAATAAGTRALGRFRAPAANEPDHTVEAELFAVELAGVPHPAAEIAELAWIDVHSPGDIALAPLTRDVVLALARRREEI